MVQLTIADGRLTFQFSTNAEFDAALVDMSTQEHAHAVFQDAIRAG